MNNKEYNNFIYECSSILKPVNQLLYHILILITLFFLFNKLTNDNIEKKRNYNSIQRTIHCIILFIIIVIFIDWFIWNNIINTSFFISILIIYIYYNLQNIKLISIFINTTENLNKTEHLNLIDILDTNTDTDTTRINKQHNSYKISKCDIPLNLSKYTRQHTQHTQHQQHQQQQQPQQHQEPLPYNKYNKENNNTLIDVYKTDKPNTYITDKNYAEIILHNLYSDYI